MKFGGGTPPGGGNTKSGRGSKIVDTNQRRSSMTTKDKVAFIKEHGEDAYMRVPS